MTDYDLVIRNGSVIDGSGRPAFKADVGVKDGKIAAVGTLEQLGVEEIDATGKIVTPGFVDIHTHYDGQVTWENRLAPSSNHGVTTVITGNCGVGFAPCRRGDHQKLIKVMEGVEDIPELVMAAGIPWNWETFPQYLDAVAKRSFDIDVGVQVPHSPIRVYVMGDRGVNHEPSTDEDRRRMADIVTEAIKAGAIGVTTSRSLNHRAKDGTPAPSVRTDAAEVLALAEGLGAAKAGVFQLITGGEPVDVEMDLIQRIAETSARPVSFTLGQTSGQPDRWRHMLSHMKAANASGQEVRGQIMCRPVGVLGGLELSFNPFSTKPSYKAIADLPLARRVAIMRDPTFKAKLLAEAPEVDPTPLANQFLSMAPNMFVLGEQPDYAPPREQRIRERAEALGVDPYDLIYDLLLEQDGHAIVYLPIANYVEGNLDVTHAMLTHPLTLLGLGDGGAHYGVICDAGYPTFVLTYWVTQAPENQRVSLEWAIQALSQRTAQAVGLKDRGVIAEGMKADLNVIDFERLSLHAPHPVYNLPAGGRRLQQNADGYVATIVSGQITYRNGEPTGNLPGRLIRGDGWETTRQNTAAALAN